MVSRHRARNGELADVERSRNALCNPVSRKQKTSWTQVNATVHEHEDGCLVGKIYYRFDKRTAAENNLKNNLIIAMKKKKTYMTSMRSLVFF